LRTPIYFVLMAFSAALSLARGFIIAGILSPEKFTRYAVVVTLGTFLSSLLSFGLVEGTVKQFPRIAVAGGAGNLLSLSNVAVKRLIIRALACLPLFVLAGYLFDPQHWQESIAVLLIACGVAVLGLLASVQRALLDLLSVALSNGVRAAFYLGLASLGALTFGLYGALAGEIVGGFFGAVASRELFKRTLRAIRSSARDLPTGDVASIKAEGGVTLFIAYTAVAAPGYLDRAYVVRFFPAADSASYALLMLFTTGAVVLSNIVGQKVGPEIISMEKAGASVGELVGHVLRWSGIVTAFWCAGMTVVGLIVSSGFLASLFAKYALTGPMFVAIILLGCVQTSALFEFILIARDMERRLLVLALIYLGTTFFAAIFVAAAGWSLLSLVCLLALSRLLYLALMLGALK
jgi:hypothetical protein